MAFSSTSTSSSSSSSTFVSQEEFNLFHKIDRELYAILAVKIRRDPMEALQIMAFWLWLERAGFRHIVFRMLRLPLLLINELADEAAAALAALSSDRPPPFSDLTLTRNFLEREISLRFLYANRQIAVQGIDKLRNDVCFRAFQDIMDTALSHNIKVSAASTPAVPPWLPPSTTTPPAGTFDDGGDPQLQAAAVAVTPEERAMFVTFSKGYPVHEWEVREFFTGSHGDCIETFQMQEVAEPSEQALFARIVFRSAATIDNILGGHQRVKFTINGKHIWARKFIPKKIQQPPSPSPPPPSAVV
ncbi:uncharacterized protein LOC111016553 [Momordica charantia]|uniref:Uncharacterized protein LOC111016553 n=1 Tax=Momordica charantia TaxID=3673 RepID=A0A6J1D1R3_MOMCH|nr:uncharacterized protein LOC111016553 [Momordica charantia]